MFCVVFRMVYVCLLMCGHRRSLFYFELCIVFLLMQNMGSTYSVHSASLMCFIGFVLASFGHELNGHELNVWSSIVYGTTKIVYGTTNTNARVGIGMLRGKFRNLIKKAIN